jgi:hypothetical protein
MMFKRGREPSVHTRRTMRLAFAMHRALAALGTPPETSTDYVSAVIAQLNSSNQPDGGPVGMFGNGPPGFQGVPQGVGDCTCADSAHRVMLNTANGGTIVVPADADVLTMYETVSGYVLGNESTDGGADEATVCSYMGTTGLAGIKSAGNGMIDPTSMDHIRWAVQIFGACRLGMVADQQMEDQFSALEPWTTAAAANDPNAGGHDPLAVFYDANYLYVWTWGGGAWPKGLQPVAWALVANPAFLEEAHVELYPSFVRAGGTAPSGFDLAGLTNELAMVEATS